MGQRQSLASRVATVLFFLDMTITTRRSELGRDNCALRILVILDMVTPMLRCNIEEGATG